MSEPSIPLIDVAEDLGVHYMTAYRYVRTGALHAMQVDGRWYVEPGELQRFRERASGRAGRRPGGATAQRDPERIARLIDRLVGGDEAGAWTIVDQLVATGWERTGIVTQLLSPAMQEIGDRWAAGTVSIAEEHVASGLMHRLLARLGAVHRTRGRTTGTVLLAAVSGERHALPLSLVADVLRDQGLRVVDLGADTPADEVRDAAQAQDRLIGVGPCATSALGSAARRSIRDAAAGVRAATGRPVLLGGSAVGSEQEARRLGCDAWSATLGDVVNWFTSPGVRQVEEQ